ncbi:MAG: hypothetical protein COS90_01285 [Deltaproteobacteria bacterium CG07_land_8_20_14_0_80_60_11]|nr:MAG: hypothetical protein COS90_01285 [Deltaproteobacteria bacterium CG07_land_8_20_14_0_80_60_11]
MRLAFPAYGAIVGGSHWWAQPEGGHLGPQGGHLGPQGGHMGPQGGHLGPPLQEVNYLDERNWRVMGSLGLPGGQELLAPGGKIG